MSVGISLLLHQNFGRAAELTRALLREGCKVAVHIDAKTPEPQIAAYISEFANTPALTMVKRIKCEWGTFSLVRAQVRTSRALLDNYRDVTHVVQLSGSCLPTRPIAELLTFLHKNRGTDYIESVVAGENNWIKGGLESERFSLYFLASWRRQRRLFDISVTLQRKFGIKRTIPSGLEAHVGSQWWALCRETLQAILNDPNLKQYDRYFSKCWIPDESYFQTLVRKHAKRIESRSLTFSRFDQHGNPMLFYDDHLEYLEHLSGFFVRKVWNGSDQLYDVLLAKDFSASPRDREMRLAFGAQTEQLESRRNNGRTGLSMQSRVLKHNKGRSETAAPYSVLVGFNKAYPMIDNWLTQQINQPVQGDLFAINTVEMAQNAYLSVGNLSGNGIIRDYAPIEYLTNFLWNNRHSPITFQFWSAKKAKVFSFIANDPNACIHYVRSAWAVELMQENITNINVLKSRATAMMALDDRRIDALKSGHATFKVYSLAETLAKPAAVLYELIATLAPKSETMPRALPEMIDWQGLENFANLLKNNGMNIDFELAEQIRPDWHDQKTNPVLIAE